MKTSRDNKILEMYYECALKEVADQKEEIEYLKNKLVEASKRIQELESENLIWTQRCSKAEGKLNRAKNIIAMLTGREEWQMIKIENIDVYGWEAAIRGVRNPKNSWHLMDSGYNNGEFEIGENDYKLLKNLTIAGPEHRKWNRMVTVTIDITAPLYWWKEYDTYKVGTVANSCSTMHKIQAKEFELDDFSHEHLGLYPKWLLSEVISKLNENREGFNKTKDKDYWWNMIQLLPTSYNQKRTVHLNYEVLGTIYHQRRHHKLDEWVEFCDTIKTLPYSEFITREFEQEGILCMIY